MPTPLPPSVQETLGDPAAGDFARWLETYVEERAVVRDEYREVLTRLDVIDERIDGTSERLDRMDERFEKRFDQIDQRLDEQSAQFNQRIDAVNERIDRLHEQMRVQTRWTVGTIALFGTIVTVLLAIAEFGA
jgi:tetrahydromethanopterin S-methyltransferase subunit G